MSPSRSIEDQLREIVARLDAVESRLAVVESRRSADSREDEVAHEPDDEEPWPGLGLDVFRLTTALGRALIVLGGAFLLRALTDAGTLPPALGVSIGLLYGLAWMVTSTIAARRHDAVRALFDGATALVISFPLIVEATLRFKLLSAAASTALLMLVTGGSLSAAFASDFETLAWLASMGGVATGLTLMVQLGVVAPYSVYFTGLGVATLWLGYLREWRGLRWPTGVLAATAAYFVTVRVTGTPSLDSPSTAWFVQGLLLGGYLTSIAVRTLVRGRQVIVFEIVATILVLLVSVGGALTVSRSVGFGGLILGSTLVGLGAVAYLVPFAVLARDSRGALNFYFYSTLALIFVLLGLGVAMTGTPQSVALASLCVLLTVAWSRSGRVTLGGHAVVALVTAAISGGLPTIVAAAFAGRLPDSMPGGPAGLTLVIALGITTIRAANCATSRPVLSDIPAIVVALVALTGTAGALTLALARVIGIGPDDAGALATLRTALLSTVAVASAWLNRPGPGSAIGKLAYPLLVAIGIKLLVDDFRSSSAATLFIALACYGAALVFVPRIRRA